MLTIDTSLRCAEPIRIYCLAQAVKLLELRGISKYSMKDTTRVKETINTVRL